MDRAFNCLHENINNFDKKDSRSSILKILIIKINQSFIFSHINLITISIIIDIIISIIIIKIIIIIKTVIIMIVIIIIKIIIIIIIII